MTGLRRRLSVVEGRKAASEAAARARAAEGERARERLYALLVGKARRHAECGDVEDRADVAPIERIARAWARGGERAGGAMLMQWVRLRRTLPPEERRAAFTALAPEGAAPEDEGAP
ncbi:MAG: hypothetical protein ACFBWO_07685 [Paracoccaceae bacterium]